MDGRLLALDPPTPSSYLAQAPRGAYTALRLPRPFFAVDWAQHVARLEQSIGLLHEAGLVDYGAWHGMESEKGNTLADLLLLTAHSALRALPAPGGPACLVLLACPGAPLQVHAVAQPLVADPYCTVPPGWAAVLGPGRALPLAKDSAWVRERAPLEGLRRPGVVEVLLADAAGGLLEGLVTNFFVISGPATASQRASDYTLQTAGEKDGVLAGTARRAALRAAAACGLTVLEQPPDPSHRSAWREAFLTNRYTFVAGRLYKRVPSLRHSKLRESLRQLPPPPLLITPTQPVQPAGLPEPHQDREAGALGRGPATL
ncbi:hypothetical protein F751_4674 [Auxenochlorella protothecoides]|uniref:Uncharacterized protein n=1 Tax=Auxenochlorella protothecoides TaxID=3075 RepID=A0A087SKC7_AUXPR|nr:hypothetical protein F751_4674 [Auxenochlorella protothecoides]KFM26181.1 hypothetical protein F751_4674 [Auxenochlorella protothecoides]